MKRLAVLAFTALLAGCSHTGVAVNSSGSLAAGTTAVSGQVVAGGSGGAALALFALAAIAIHASESSNGGTTYRVNPFDAASSTQPAPAMDASRRVNEQDCSKPIQDWSANLRCK